MEEKCLGADRNLIAGTGHAGGEFRLFSMKKRRYKIRVPTPHLLNHIASKGHIASNCSGDRATLGMPREHRVGCVNPARNAANFRRAERTRVIRQQFRAESSIVIHENQHVA